MNTAATPNASKRKSGISIGSLSAAHTTPRKVRLVLTLELEGDDDEPGESERTRHPSGDSGIEVAQPDTTAQQPASDATVPTVPASLAAEDATAADPTTDRAPQTDSFRPILANICVLCTLGRACAKHPAATGIEEPAVCDAIAAAPETNDDDALLADPMETTLGAAINDRAIARAMNEDAFDAPQVVPGVLAEPDDEEDFRAGLINRARRTSSETDDGEERATDYSATSEDTTRDDDPRDWTVRSSEMEADPEDTTIEWFEPAADESGVVASRVKARAAAAEGE